METPDIQAPKTVPLSIPEPGTPERKKIKKDLGNERVRLAMERLQLAWLRFSMTMIALGFSSYRFFYSRLEEGKTPLLNYVTGREIGLFLLLVGFFGLLQATAQHIKTYKKLRIYNPGVLYSVSLVQSYLVLALAFCLLLFVIFEL
jgi:uncharacterized membrane protein YidH (DUF202 family)